MDDLGTPVEGQNTDDEMSTPPALPTTTPRSRAVIGAGLLILIAVLAVAAIAFLFPPSGDETVSESGLTYIDEVVGTGDPVGPGDMVSVHYTGLLEDGTVFDSSVDRGEPFSFLLGSGSVIQGWDEGVSGMQVGGKRVLTIPPDLAYGEEGAGNGLIPANATLKFEVELLGTVELSVEDLVVGEGPEVVAGNTVSLDYVVSFEDGTELDNSANTGPLEFVVGVGQMIPGVDVGVEGMQVGGQRVITIPPEFAFGPQGVEGVIPPNAVLIFEVELLSIQ